MPIFGSGLLPPVKGSFDFSGPANYTSGYVELDFGTDISVQKCALVLGIKPDFSSVASGEKRVIASFAPDGRTSLKAELGFENFGTTRLFWNRGSDGCHYNVAPDTASFTHIVATWESNTSERMAIYVNGSRVANDVGVTLNDPFGATRYVTLGNYAPRGAYVSTLKPFDGSIYHAAFYYGSAAPLIGDVYDSGFLRPAEYLDVSNVSMVGLVNPNASFDLAGNHTLDVGSGVTFKAGVHP